MREPLPVPDLNKGPGRNTYKFIPFNERIKDIKLTVSSLKRAQDSLEDADCFFQSSLLKWREENTTLPFARFAAEVDPYSKSLPILLFNKRTVAQLIVNSLKELDTLACEPLMDLSVQLVKDLGVEIADDWPAIFEAVSGFINVRDAKIVEAFSFLVRRLKTDEHVNTAIDEFLAVVRDAVGSKAEDWTREGVAVLVAEVCKGASGTLYSRAGVFLLDLMKRGYEEIDGGMQGNVPRLLQHVFVIISTHVSQTVCVELWTLLLSEVRTHMSVIKEATGDETKSWWQLALTVELLNVVAGNKKGDLVTDPGPLFQIVTSSISQYVKATNTVHPASLPALLKLSHTLLLITPTPKALSHVRDLTTAVMSLPSFVDVASWARVASQVGMETFVGSIWKPFLERLARTLGSESIEDADIALVSLSDLIRGDWVSKVTSVSFAAGMLRVPPAVARHVEDTVKRSALSAEHWDCSALQESDKTSRSIGRAAAVVSVLGRIDLPGEPMIHDLASLSQSAARTLPQEPVYDAPFRREWYLQGTLIGQAMEAVALVTTKLGRYDVGATLWSEVVESLLEKASTAVDVLKGVATLAECIHKRFVEFYNIYRWRRVEIDRFSVSHSDVGAGLFSPSKLSLAYSILKRNLSSPSVNLRLHTLRILRCYDQIPLLSTNSVGTIETFSGKSETSGSRKRKRGDVDHIVGNEKAKGEAGESKSSKTCDVFDLLYHMTAIPSLPQSFRDKTVYFTKVAILASSRQMPELYDEVVPRCIIGMLGEGFAPLWKDAKTLLASAVEVKGKVMWEVLWDEISKFHSEHAHSYFPRPYIPEVEYFKFHEELFPVRTSRKLQGDFPELALDTWAMRKVQDAQRASENLFNNNGSVLQSLLIASTTEPERTLDAWFYYLQLLKALEDTPALVEQRSRDLVIVFLQFIVKDFLDRETETNRENHSNGFDGGSSLLPPPSSKAKRDRLLQYLTLLSKFRHPERIHRSSELHGCFMKLLTKGDQKIQDLALKCLENWKYGFMATYREALYAVIDDSKFRNQLSLLNWEEIDSAIIHESEKDQFMDILTRILYGKLVTRRGKDTAKAGLKTRRLAIFAFLAQCRQQDRSRFLSLMTETFGDLLSILHYPRDKPPPAMPASGFVSANRAGHEAMDKIPMPRILGLLHNIEDFIRQLRHLAEPFLPFLCEILLYVLNRAETMIEGSHGVTESMSAEDAEPADTLDADGTTSDDLNREQSSTKHIRILRQQVLRRFGEIFAIGLDLPFAPLVGELFRISLAEKIPRLESENTQAPTALLLLFATWASNPPYLKYLTDFDHQLLPKLFGLLSAKKVATKVTVTVLSVIEDLLAAQESQSAAETTEFNVRFSIQPCVPHILRNIDNLLEEISGSRVPGESANIFRRTIDILARLAAFVTDTYSATKLVDLLLPSLKKSTKVIDHQTKAKILLVIRSFVPHLHAIVVGDITESRLYGIASRLLSTLRDRACRSELDGIFQAFAKIDSSLQAIASVISDLNAVSHKRLDEIDFARKFNAFAEINNTLLKELDPMRVLPLLHHLIYDIQDADEYAVRTASSNGLITFIRRVASERGGESAEAPKFMEQISFVIYPAIKRGMKNRSIGVRQELLTVLSEMVKSFPTDEHFREMVPLLAGEDEEANVFNNLQHLQVHRRVRAMRRLAEHCVNDDIRSNTIAGVFVPLISHIVFESDRVTDHHLINEAIAALGILSTQLSWGAYYSLVRIVLAGLVRHEELSKVLIRLLSSILDGFHFEVCGATSVELKVSSAAALIEHPEVAESDDDDEDIDLVDSKADKENRTRRGVEQSEHIFSVVLEKLLPGLYKYLKQEDDETVSIRVPIALAIAKLLKRLPPETLRSQLPQLLLNLCVLLRSRMQSARDSTRETLSKILELLGPDYLSFVIVQLKTSLNRGYQKHVMTYTVNSLIANMAPNLKIGDIDYCLEELVPILIDDIFGDVADEKEIKELAGKTKEMKSHKSFETLETLTKVIRFTRVGDLLVPLKRIMVETDKAKSMSKVDEVLRRISAGLALNADVATADFLIFIHGLLTESLPLSKVAQIMSKKKTLAEENFLVQLRAKDALGPISHFATNAHRFTKFGLSLLFSGLRRHRIDLTDENTRGMIAPLVGTVGECLYSRSLEVVAEALKVLSLVCGSNIAGISATMPVILRKVFELLAASANADAELNQAILKLITVVLRDRPDVTITEKQLAAILKVVKPELDQLESRSTTFGVLRAIMTRKIVNEDMYDIMDSIAQLLITSQSSETRDLSRSTWLQFLLDYPQGTGRLRKQMDFLIQNLSYEFEAGRNSVLEMLTVVFQKFPVSVLLEFAEGVFLALVVVIVNDESRQCRRAAGELTKKVLQKCFEGQPSGDRLLTLVKKWFAGTSKLRLRRTAAQVYGIIIESSSLMTAKHVPELLASFSSSLQSSRWRDESGEEISRTWELDYYVLNAFSKVLSQHPRYISASDSVQMWMMAKEFAVHPHSWIRTLTSRLWGMYFGAVDPSSGTFEDSSQQASILQNPASAVDLAKAMCIQLEATEMTEDLKSLLLQNIVYVAKRLHNLESLTTVNIESGDESDDHTGTTHSHPLTWLIRKVAYIARTERTRTKMQNARTIIFKFYGAISAFLPKDVLVRHLPTMIATAYRVVVDETERNADDLKLLAQETLETYQKFSGTDAYLEAYNTVHAASLRVRQERKAQKDLDTVARPQIAAKRKIEAGLKKKAHKKRKVEEHKQMKLVYR
ncbi:U3 snoRNP protein [Gonapodya sp. JEL0774]|nr:U3 snoRNP protein [Gonapodya sp. JEL0774]